MKETLLIYSSIYLIALSFNL